MERDVEKYKTLNQKLRQEISLQGDQVTSLGEKLFKAENEVMEKSEQVRALEKKMDKPTAASTEQNASGVSLAEFEKLKQVNQTMTTGMQQLQQALLDTRKEKNAIIGKSEQVCSFHEPVHDLTTDLVD